MPRRTDESYPPGDRSPSRSAGGGGWPAGRGATGAWSLPAFVTASLAGHVAALAVAALLPEPPPAHAAVPPPIDVALVVPEPVPPEPEPEPEVVEEPEAVEERPRPRLRPPEPRAEPPPAPEELPEEAPEEAPEEPPDPVEPPPAPAAEAEPAPPAETLVAAGPTEGAFAHPAGEPGGAVGGTAGGQGQGPAAAAPPAPPPPPSIDRAELRRRLLAYLRGTLWGFVNDRIDHYPVAARRSQIEGVVMLRIRLARDGRLLAVRLSRSSGHSMLDRAAIASVEGLTRVPAPPASIPWDDDRELPLPVTYQLSH